MTSETNKIETIPVPFHQAALDRAQDNWKNRKVEILLGAALTVVGLALIPVLGPLALIIAGVGIATLSHGTFQAPKSGTSDSLAQATPLTPLPQIDPLAEQAFQALTGAPFDVNTATPREKAAHAILQAAEQNNVNDLPVLLQAFEKDFPENFAPLFTAAQKLVEKTQNPECSAILSQFPSKPVQLVEPTPQVQPPEPTLPPTPTEQPSSNGSFSKWLGAGVGTLGLMGMGAIRWMKDPKKEPTNPQDDFNTSNAGNGTCPIPPAEVAGAPVTAPESNLQAFNAFQQSVAPLDASCLEFLDAPVASNTTLTLPAPIMRAVTEALVSGKPVSLAFTTPDNTPVVLTAGQATPTVVTAQTAVAVQQLQSPTPKEFIAIAQKLIQTNRPFQLQIDSGIFATLYTFQQPKPAVLPKVLALPRPAPESNQQALAAFQQSVAPLDASCLEFLDTPIASNTTLTLPAPIMGAISDALVSGKPVSLAFTTPDNTPVVLTAGQATPTVVTAQTAVAVQQLQSPTPKEFIAIAQKLIQTNRPFQLQIDSGIFATLYTFQQPKPAVLPKVLALPRPAPESNQQALAAFQQSVAPLDASCLEFLDAPVASNTTLTLPAPIMRAVTEALVSGKPVSLAFTTPDNKPVVLTTGQTTPPVVTAQMAVTVQQLQSPTPKEFLAIAQKLIQTNRPFQLQIDSGIFATLYTFQQPKPAVLPKVLALPRPAPESNQQALAAFQQSVAPLDASCLEFLDAPVASNTTLTLPAPIMRAVTEALVSGKPVSLAFTTPDNKPVVLTAGQTTPPVVTAQMAVTVQQLQSPTPKEFLAIAQKLIQTNRPFQLQIDSGIFATLYTFQQATPAVLPKVLALPRPAPESNQQALAAFQQSVAPLDASCLEFLDTPIASNTTLTLPAPIMGAISDALVSGKPVSLAFTTPDNTPVVLTAGQATPTVVTAQTAVAVQQLQSPTPKEFIAIAQKLIQTNRPFQLQIDSGIFATLYTFQQAAPAILPKTLALPRPAPERGEQALTAFNRDVAALDASCLELLDAPVAAINTVKAVAGSDTSQLPASQITRTILDGLKPLNATGEICRLGEAAMTPAFPLPSPVPALPSTVALQQVSLPQNPPVSIAQILEQCSVAGNSTLSSPLDTSALALTTTQTPKSQILLEKIFAAIGNGNSAVIRLWDPQGNPMTAFFGTTDQPMHPSGTAISLSNTAPSADLDQIRTLLPFLLEHKMPFDFQIGNGPTAIAFSYRNPDSTLLLAAAPAQASITHSATAFAQSLKSTIQSLSPSFASASSQIIGAATVKLLQASQAALQIAPPAASFVSQALTVSPSPLAQGITQIGLAAGAVALASYLVPKLPITNPFQAIDPTWCLPNDFTLQAPNQAAFVSQGPTGRSLWGTSTVNVPLTAEGAVSLQLAIAKPMRLDSQATPSESPIAAIAASFAPPAATVIPETPLENLIFPATTVAPPMPSLTSSKSATVLSTPSMQPMLPQPPVPRATPTNPMADPFVPPSATVVPSAPLENVILPATTAAPPRPSLTSSATMTSTPSMQPMLPQPPIPRATPTNPMADPFVPPSATVVPSAPLENRILPATTAVPPMPSLTSSKSATVLSTPSIQPMLPQPPVPRATPTNPIADPFVPPSATVVPSAPLETVILPATTAAPPMPSLTSSKSATILSTPILQTATPSATPSVAKRPTNQFQSPKRTLRDAFTSSINTPRKEKTQPNPRSHFGPLFAKPKRQLCVTQQSKIVAMPQEPFLPFTNTTETSCPAETPKRNLLWGFCQAPKGNVTLVPEEPIWFSPLEIQDTAAAVQTESLTLEALPPVEIEERPAAILQAKIPSSAYEQPEAIDALTRKIDQLDAEIKALSPKFQKSAGDEHKEALDAVTGKLDQLDAEVEALSAPPKKSAGDEQTEALDAFRGKFDQVEADIAEFM